MKRNTITLTEDIDITQYYIFRTSEGYELSNVKPTNEEAKYNDITYYTYGQKYSYIPESNYNYNQAKVVTTNDLLVAVKLSLKVHIYDLLEGNNISFNDIVKTSNEHSINGRRFNLNVKEIIYTNGTFNDKVVYSEPVEAIGTRYISPKETVELNYYYVTSNDNHMLSAINGFNLTNNKDDIKTNQTELTIYKSAYYYIGSKQSALKVEIDGTEVLPIPGTNVYYFDYIDDEFITLTITSSNDVNDFIVEIY